MGKKKQSKQSWRKRGAVIEDATLAARQRADQERRTGGKLSAMSDDQLFEIQPAAAVASKPIVGLRKKRQGTALLKSKQLWAERVVASNPHIPVVVKPPITKSRAAPSKHTLMLREKLGKVTSGLLQSKAQRELAAMAAPDSAADPLDIWSDAAPSQPARRSSRQARGPEPSTHSAAVPLPAEGASWNPTEEAHYELLSAAVGHEVERLRREKAHDRFVLMEHSDEEDDDQLMQRRQRLTAAGATDDSTAADAAMEQDDGSDADQAGDPSMWHVDREKLTRVQLNKRARQREREKAAAEAKAQRVKEKQLGRVGQLMHEIKKADVELQQRQEEEAALEAARPKKLAGKRHKPKRPDVLLTDEQPTALRQLATEGSLLADRFDSLQARHMLEVRDKQAKRSHKGPRRHIQKEPAQVLHYKSPFYKGPLPAWM